MVTPNILTSLTKIKNEPLNTSSMADTEGKNPPASLDVLSIVNATLVTPTPPHILQEPTKSTGDLSKITSLKNTEVYAESPEADKEVFETLSSESEQGIEQLNCRCSNI